MKRKQKLPELLAPAGDMQALYAAVAAGADAVYVGGKRFGARAFAKNFDSDELILAVKYCHAHGVRLYVTLNTLIYDKELDEALEYARFLAGIGIDALIVADLGIVSLIREKIPTLELHASTQMGVHNSEGVNAAYRMGASRVVLARECSSDNIGAIVAKSDAECEVFLHGALCVCHSGQCLFSSLVGGRSGNRGECAQPCRLPYNNGKYILSLKDLSLAGHIDELIRSGVSSLKIEGRMKSADYVYRVTSIYRRLLDEHRCASPEETRELDRIFSRGGFTDGYFRGRLGGGMTGIRSEEQKKASREISGGAYERVRTNAFMKVRIKRGMKAELAMEAALPSRWDLETECERLSVSFYGDIPEEAKTLPLTDSDVRARLSKLGNTAFTVDPEKIELELDDGLMLPVSKLNELRRSAAEALENKYLRPIKPKAPAGNMPRGESRREPCRLGRTAQFFDIGVFRELAAERGILSGFDISFVPLFERSGLDQISGSCANGVYVPPIIMENELEEVRAALKAANRDGAVYALVGNIGHINIVKEAGLLPVGDIRMNVTNRYAKEELSYMGVCAFILSPELTMPMARDIGGGIVVSGRIPLMVTERCFIKENFGCDKCGKASLVDRMGKKFPILRERHHRNVIFNSVHTYMGDKRDELAAAGLTHAHFIFSTENAGIVKSLVLAYESMSPLPLPFCRMKQRIGAK